MNLMGERGEIDLERRVNSILEDLPGGDTSTL